MSDAIKLDACEICHGAKGGTPGNEKVVDGHVICDYCHAAMKTVVHHLECGITACPISALHGQPSNWPVGHTASTDWDKITCKPCLSWKPKTP